MEMSHSGNTSENRFERKMLYFSVVHDLIVILKLKGLWEQKPLAAADES